MAIDGAVRPAGWLRALSEDSDVIISSRARLARNIAGYPFLTRASETQQREIEERVRQAALAASIAPDFQYFTLNGLPESQRQILVERRLISQDLAQAPRPCGVGFGLGEQLSIMVNEEDHVRIQAIQAGMSVRSAWRIVDAADTALEQRIAFAFHPEFGYLTACPTNVGSGARASVMLHLPALSISGELQKVFAMASKIDFVVRGLYGESSEGLGDFYQVSNQRTLGRPEEEIVSKLETVIPQIVRYERKVREALLKDDRAAVEDRVFRAYGLLSQCRTAGADEALGLLSHVRLGVCLGLLPQFDLGAVNSLFLYTQPGHLQVIAGRSLSSAEAGVFRADMLRREIGRTEA